MTSLAFDSSTVIAWVLKERGWTAVDRLLRETDGVVLPSPALMEVIRIVRLRGNSRSGRVIADTLAAQGLIFVHADTEDLIDAAALLEAAAQLSAAQLAGAHLPATHLAGAVHGETGPSLSTADALILTIAGRLNRPIVTRDRLWGELASAGLVRIQVHVF